MKSELQELILKVVRSGIAVAYCKEEDIIIAAPPGVIKSVISTSNDKRAFTILSDRPTNNDELN